ncbi:MAG: RNA-guided pseudouridylation complex pseudouridine synthase subunit Cbf5 [Crenarchaeota archaeon]|nr:RNA-guided pseudouridylation complex pseudouridine synthase subunit Cbf5 [Thermoproteota archaeon]
MHSEVREVEAEGKERNVEVLHKLENEETNPEWGYYPHKRPIDLHIKYGFVVLDKPRGPTSHEAVAWLKRLLGLRKAGHAGTLDPGVSGVLPVALEESTKALQAISQSVKEYVAVMKLHEDVPEDKLIQVLKLFEGEIYQKPPLRCAVKRQLRTKKVYRLELLEKNGKYCIIRMVVEAGTYARKLIHDIGEILGCGANMRELRRTRAGLWTENEAVTLNQLREAYFIWRETGYEDLLRQYIRPVEDMVKHLPKIWVRDSAVDALCHGAALAAPGVVKLTSDVEKGKMVALMTLKDELIALGIATMSARDILAAGRGIVAKITRVVMRRGTYPKLWKSAKEKGEVRF